MTSLTRIQNIYAIDAWKATPFMKQFQGDCKSYSFKKRVGTRLSETMFGTSKMNQFAVDRITNSLKNSINPYYTYIPSGEILKSSPTKEHCVKRMIDEIKDLKVRWELHKPHLNITDNWADYVHKKECVPFFKKKDDSFVQTFTKPLGKRFSAKEIDNVKDYILNYTKNSQGFLAEGYVISFINNNILCPECKAQRAIGLCSRTGIDMSSSFRDGICMCCLSKGVITLFEIKVRNDKSIKNMNGTNSGSFIDLNTLFAIKANIYLVIASRDTGNVRIGKVDSYMMEGNSFLLYSIQEETVPREDDMSPSSYVTCSKGLYIIPNKMELPLNVVLSEKICESILQEAYKAEDIV